VNTIQKVDRRIADDFDIQMEDDRLWFKNHPNATQRQRPPYPWEIDFLQAACGVIIKEVLVSQIREGHRIRQFFTTSKTKRALRPRGFGIEKHRIEASKFESYSAKPL
jgi:hypothetical protein